MPETRPPASGFRGQPYACASPDEAIAAMVRALGNRARTTSQVDAVGSLGRILAEPVLADRDSPNFDYSSMDGYAVRLKQVARGGEFAVLGESLIGREPPAFASEPSVVRIVTGAPIPSDCDAVVRREDVVEHVERGLSGVARVSISTEIACRLRLGENIRKQGENARADEVIIPGGEIVTPAILGAMAAVGAVRPSVRCQLAVAIVNTGDELVPAAGTPGRYEIRNSNGIAVHATLASRAWVEVRTVEQVRDGLVQAALHAASTHADVIVLTGGVSMGHRDPARGAIEALGAPIIFHGLPQRPGKPMLGAVLRAGERTVAIFGLPGNPVSSMVTAERIVVPTLATWCGARPPAAPLVRLANDDGKRLDLWWHRLVRLNSNGQAELVEVKGSGDLIAAARADGFVEVPPKQATPPADVFAYYPWNR